MLTSPLKSLKSTQIVIMVSGQPVQIFHSIYSCVRFLNLFLCEIIQFFYAIRFLDLFLHWNMILASPVKWKIKWINWFHLSSYSSSPLSSHWNCSNLLLQKFPNFALICLDSIFHLIVPLETTGWDGQKVSLMDFCQKYGRGWKLPLLNTKLCKIWDNHLN